MMLRKFFDNCPVSEPADVLQLEQTKLLYANLPAAIAINLLLALLLAGVESAVVSPYALFVWLSVVGMTLLLRIALLLAWRRSEIDAGNGGCWLRRFRIAVVATGAAWGMGALLLFPVGDIDHQSYLAFAMAGLSAGAISALAVDRVSTLGFLIPMLLPLVVRLWLEGGKLALSMGMMVMLFLIFIAMNASRGRRSLHENFQLRIKAEEQEQSLRQKEASLREAQQTAHVGNWELDLVGNKLSWSDEIYRIFEIDPATFDPSYEAFLNAVHPDDRAAVNLAYTRSLETREPYEISHRLLMGDGRIKWVIEKCNSFFDAQGKPVRSVGTVQDATREKEFEAILQESERRYRFLFSNNPLPMWVFAEDDFRFLEVNERAIQHYGYSREEFGRMSLRDIRPEEDIALLNQVISSSPSGVVTIEARHQKKDGTSINVRVSTMPMVFAGVPARIALVQDITEQKQAEQEREWQIRNQQALLDAIQETTFLMERNGTMLVVNGVGAQRLNATPEELVGKNIYEILPPDLAETRRAHFERIARTGKSETMEDERAGRRLLSSIYPVMDDNGGVSRFAVYAADVTQQRRVEAIEALFSAINQRVLQGQPIAELLQFICGEVARLFNLDLIWLGRKEADGAVSIMTQAGAAIGYVEGVKRLGVRWDDTPQGRGATGTAIRSGQIQVINASNPGFRLWKE
ncbi:MAG TPA: PAS domain S-box protein, partial [Gallionella sp.]|nr:PAS domain S-box protein [Gallionella sp.]